MSRRNPTYGTHPDLFSMPGTPVVKAVTDVPREELMNTKRAQFSQEEWDDELDDGVREAIYENDEDSKLRREVLRRTLVGIFGLDDASRENYAQMFLDNNPEEYIQESFRDFLRGSGAIVYDTVGERYEDELVELLAKFTKTEVVSALKDEENFAFETVLGGEGYRQPTQFIYAQFEGDHEEQIEFSQIVESYENDYYAPGTERASVRGRELGRVSITTPFPDEVRWVMQEELRRDINNEERFTEKLIEDFADQLKNFETWNYNVPLDVWYGYVPNFERINETLSESRSDSSSPIYNNVDLLATIDVVSRVQHLEELSDPDEDEKDELVALTTLMEQTLPKKTWEDADVILVRESYFPKYHGYQEHGLANRDRTTVSSALKNAYAPVDFNGATYYVRRA